MLEAVLALGPSDVVGAKSGSGPLIAPACVISRLAETNIKFIQL
jgi:hypothetical protein